LRSGAQLCNGTTDRSAFQERTDSNIVPVMLLDRMPSIKYVTPDLFRRFR
jgi:hypothetical protein